MTAYVLSVHESLAEDVACGISDDRREAARNAASEQREESERTWAHVRDVCGGTTR
jgi:hypothetical protein